MKNSKFILRIKRTKKNQKFACMGEQLAEILSIINQASKKFYWYAFDVDYINSNSTELFKSPFSNFDSTDELITISKTVEQFLSGVFIAMESKNIIWDINNLPYTDEDEEIQHEKAILEIRAFDTSYFEIYGTDHKIAELLKLAFQVC